MYKKHKSLLATFAIPQERVERFELWHEIHPVEQRHLTDNEVEMIKWLWLFPNYEFPKTFRKLAELYKENFPEIGKVRDLIGEEYFIYVWKNILKEINPVSLVYNYQELSDNNIHAAELEKIKNQVKESSNLRLSQKNNEIIWTIPYPDQTFVTELFEDEIGLTRAIKSNLSLDNLPAGFLCSYLLNNKYEVEDILNPNQFENLVGIVYEEEGWKIEQMKSTRDGGKDIILRKCNEGVITCVYVQAKKYSKKNKVGIPIVKEFISTVLFGEEKPQKGFLVTTSTYTHDAKSWLNKNALIPALIELVEKKDLISKMAQISKQKMDMYYFEN